MEKKPAPVEKTNAKSPEKKKTTPKPVKKATVLSESDEATIAKAFEISTDENDTAYISKVGGNIRKIDPSFDARTYGYSSLSKLFESLIDFQVIRNEVGDLNHPLVKRK